MTEVLIEVLVERGVLVEETSSTRRTTIPGESYSVIDGEVRRDLEPGVGVHRFLTQWQPPTVPFKWSFVKGVAGGVS